MIDKVQTNKEINEMGYLFKLQLHHKPSPQPSPELVERDKNLSPDAMHHTLPWFLHGAIYETPHSDTGWEVNGEGEGFSLKGLRSCHRVWL